MGIKSEPIAPADPTQGLVWSAIIDQVDIVASESAYISVADTPRTSFAKHPWSIGGGGAADLKEAIEEHAIKALNKAMSLIGFVCMTRADDIYFTPDHSLITRGIATDNIIINVEGDCVRDWRIDSPNTTIFPYDGNLDPLPYSQASLLHQFLWPYRTPLWLRREPNGNHREIGLTWWEWSRFQRDRYRNPFSITFAFISTHNNFVFDRGGKSFNRTAPIIKLPAKASEEEYLGILGLLNSSVGCFWMQQVCQNKGRPGANAAGADERYEMRYEHDGTKLASFPLAENPPVSLAQTLDRLAQDYAACLPAALIGSASTPDPEISHAKAPRRQEEKEG
jgi:hypothetical protein